MGRCSYSGLLQKVTSCGDFFTCELPATTTSEQSNIAFTICNNGDADATKCSIEQSSSHLPIQHTKFGDATPRGPKLVTMGAVLAVWRVVADVVTFWVKVSSGRLYSSRICSIPCLHKITHRNP